jgi:hypothetical protein
VSLQRVTLSGHGRLFTCKLRKQQLRLSELSESLRATVTIPSSRAETIDMQQIKTQTASKGHWLNTIVGVLDSSFYLTLEEQYTCTKIVSTLLDRLNIPARGKPTVLPMPIVQEVYANYYSLALETSSTGMTRNIRRVTENDCVTSLEAWRIALESMFIQAYPDLDSYERTLLAKILHDLLAAIGVPQRAASHFPDAVLRAHREIGDN